VVPAAGAAKPAAMVREGIGGQVGQVEDAGPVPARKGRA